MPLTPSKEDIALYARSLPLLNSATQLEQQGHPTSTSLLSPASHATLSSSGLLFLDPLLHMMYHIPPFRHAVFSLRVGASATPPLDPSGAAGWWLQRLYAGLSVGVRRSVGGSETLLEALGWEVEGAIASHDVSTVMASIFQAMAGADSVVVGEGGEEGEDSTTTTATTTSPAMSQLLQTFGGRWGAPSSEEEEWGSWIDVTLPMPTTPFRPTPPGDSEVLVVGEEEEKKGQEEGNLPSSTPYTDIHRGLREVCPLVVESGGGEGGEGGGGAIPPVIPPFLVLHTPRFNTGGGGEAAVQGGGSGKLSRNDTPLSIPFQLPLKPFFTPTLAPSDGVVADTHNLHAALVHSPGGVGYGALCKVVCDDGDGGGGESWVYYQGSTAAPISHQGVKDVLAGLPCISPSIPANTLSVTLIYAADTATATATASSSKSGIPPLLIPALTPDTTPGHLLTLLPAIHATFTTPATLFVATQCEDTTTTLLLTLSHRYRSGSAAGAGLLPPATLAALHGENLVACALSGAAGVASHVATVTVHVPDSGAGGGGGKKGMGYGVMPSPAHPYLLPPRSPTATLTLHFPRNATMWRVQEEVYDAWLAGAAPPGVVRGGRTSLASAATLYAKEGGSMPAFPMRRDVRLRAWEGGSEGAEAGRAFESFSTLDMATSPLCPPALYHPQYQGPTPKPCFALEVRPFSLLTPGLSEDDIPSPELLCEWKAWGVEVPRGGRIVGVRLWTPTLEASLTGVVDRVFGGGGGGEGGKGRDTPSSATAATTSSGGGGGGKDSWEKPPSLWIVLKEGEAANPAAILRAFTLKHPELTAGLQRAAGVVAPALPPPSASDAPPTAPAIGSGEGVVAGGQQHPVTCAILPFPLARAVSHWVSPTSTTSSTPSLTTLLRARASQTNFTPTHPTPLLPSSSEGLVVLPTLTLPMAPPPKPTGPKMMAKFGSKVLIPVGGGDGAGTPPPPPPSPAQLEESAAVQGYAHLDLLGVCGVSDGDEVVIIPHSTRQVSVGVGGGCGGGEGASASTITTTTAIPTVASKAINTLRALCGLRSYAGVGAATAPIESPAAVLQVAPSSTTATTTPVVEAAMPASAVSASRGTPIRLLITPPSPLPPDLATPTTTPEDLMIFGYCGKRAGVQKVVSSRAAKAIAAAAAAAAAASPTLAPFTLVAHREMSVGELKGRIVAALQAKGMATLTPESMHLRKGGGEDGSVVGGGVSLRCEEDTLASVDVEEGGRVCLVYGPPLPPLSVLLHVRITLPTSATAASATSASAAAAAAASSSSTPIPLEVSFPFPLTSRVSSLRRTLYTQLSGGGFLPPGATTPAFLRLRASQAPSHTPSPTVSRVLRNESVLRSVLPVPYPGPGAGSSSSSSGGGGGSGGDERHLTVEVLAVEEIIRPGDAVVKLRQLATPGDGTPCGNMLVEVMAAAAAAAAGGGGGEGGEGGVGGGQGEEGEDSTTDLNHAQLCPPIDAILPTGGAESSSSSGGGGGAGCEVTLATLQRAVSGALSSASPPHTLSIPPTRLALAVLGAYGPALTTWEACNRLEWGATTLKVSEGCTVVWRVVEGGGDEGGGEGEADTAAAATAASSAASGGGVRAISALRSKVGEVVEKENGEGGEAAAAAAAKRPTPWQMAKRGGKPPTHAASGSGSDDVEILVPKKRNQ